VLTSTLLEGFHKQLRADFEIVRIKPDTLAFSFDLVRSKMVPVMPDLDIVTDKEFFVKGPPVSQPDSVLISGPKPVIDTVRFVRTKKRRFTGVNQPLSKNIHLVTSKEFTISEKRVTVNIDVEQYTEARLELPVRIINKPDSIEVRLFPDVVNVHLLVAISDYKGIFESNISALIDFANVNPETADRLQVIIANVPSYANTVRYTPQEIDYIVEKRQK
jgi:hypothetical protein